MPPGGVPRPQRPRQDRRGDGTAPGRLPERLPARDQRRGPDPRRQSQGRPALAPPWPTTELGRHLKVDPASTDFLTRQGPHQLSVQNRCRRSQDRHLRKAARGPPNSFTFLERDGLDPLRKTWTSPRRAWSARSIRPCEELRPLPERPRSRGMILTRLDRCDDAVKSWKKRPEIEPSGPICYRPGPRLPESGPTPDRFPERWARTAPRDRARPRSAQASERDGGQPDDSHRPARNRRNTGLLRRSDPRIRSHDPLSFPEPWHAGTWLAARTRSRTMGNGR